MVRAAPVLLSAVFFAGCAPYKLQRGAPPYDKGYAAARDGKVIPEYTVGKDNTLPADIKLAQARFRRRKARVEDYYKKMGGIENRFKENVPNRLGFMAKMAGAVFCLPGRIVSAYRYELDPKYRDRVDKRDAEAYRLEEEKNKKLKEELVAYVQKDLAWEEEKMLK